MTEIKAEGVRKSILEELQGLLGSTMADQVLLDEAVLEIITRITGVLGREVLIMTNDKNKIVHVGIGDASTVPLDDSGVDEKRRGLNKLRVIHTHPGGSARLSPEDFSSAKHLSLQCMIAVAVNEGRATQFGIGVPVEDSEGTGITYSQGVCESLKQLNRFPLELYIAAANRILRNDPNAGYTFQEEQERALLVGVDLGRGTSGMEAEVSMEELKRLVETADGEVVKTILQSRPQADPVFYLGRGKLLEITRIVQNEDINLIVANDELNANQIGNIEAITGVKTVDRTTVILDIFARHASTREGKLQVELAQQKYRLAHLKGLGIVLSRTGGGIGTRGPGEKKLETDRRHIRRQIDELERKNAKINKTNTLNALKRQKNNVKTAALVGYTNSGKSTLFNVLTESAAVEQDGLFITLDSTLRKVRPEQGDYLVSDTVGFIEKLPHELIKAFKTTLKEVETADLLLHVVDAANPNFKEQIAVVEQVMAEISPPGQPVLLVYNKIDKLTDEERAWLFNRTRLAENIVCISAKAGEGLEALYEKIAEGLSRGSRELRFCIPYADSKSLAMLHERAEVVSVDYSEDGTLVLAVVGEDFPLAAYESYLVKEDANEQ
ncbi:MAG: GTPase HflX [Eubacterium sp.]|nr:GTPase HflX [Eubacterium sp.]